MNNIRVSVVTPTLHRPQEVAGLLENLAQQTVLPYEIILVDGAPSEERETEEVVRLKAKDLPFQVLYVRQGGGTAIQRNVGIDLAWGDFVAFIDDDVRLEADFFERIMEVFDKDPNGEVGGIVGYRTNAHFRLKDQQRWRWYRRLRLLSTYEPGRYDFQNGYPINANMQPPFRGTREVDFMTTACAVWRRQVFDSGLRFDPFFRDYGVLEDAHFSLRAGRRWRLLQCGDARCVELHSPHGRVDRRRIGYKCVVNYYYVFRDIAGPLTWRQQMGFWRYQAFELLRIGASLFRRRRKDDILELLGRVQGYIAVALGRYLSGHSCG